MVGTVGTVETVGTVGTVGGVLVALVTGKGILGLQASRKKYLRLKVNNNILSKVIRKNRG